MKPAQPALPEEDLHYYYSGREDCHPGKQWTSVRDHYLFHFVLQGKGTARINGADVPILPGQGFLYAPHEYSSYKADLENPWSYVWFAFHGRQVPRYLGHWGLGSGDHVYQSDNTLHTGGELADILPGFSLCHSEFEQLSLLYQAFSVLERHALGQGSRPRLNTSPDRFMGRIHEYIHRNFARNSASVENMAAWMGVSRTHLCQQVREHSGRTPRDLLLDYRMEQAKRMLTWNDLGIAEIGASIGYDDQLSFSRAFRNHLGMPPREYRRQTRTWIQP